MLTSGLGNLSFHPVQPTDLEFLCTVYASTRMEELSILGWSEGQKLAFLNMQFLAQHNYYQQCYKDADFLIIHANGQRIGRIYIARWPKEIRIVDVAILPEYRNSGYGTSILQGILSEAATAGKPVTIHVERNNPALQLYRRLGFVKKGEQGVYDEMEWSNGLP